MTTDYIALYEDLKDLRTALERAKDAADDCGSYAEDISSALEDMLYELRRPLSQAEELAGQQEEKEEMWLRQQYYKDL